MMDILKLIFAGIVAVAVVLAGAVATALVVGVLTLAALSPILFVIWAVVEIVT